MPTGGEGDVTSITPAMRYAFSPVHKAALGVAFGIVCGFVTAAATFVQLAVSPADGAPLSLLNQFFYGYEVSPVGAAVGFFWAFITGFVAGWFVAFLKNLFTALWIFGLRVKSAMTQPFLDHI